MVFHWVHLGFLHFLFFVFLWIISNGLPSTSQILSFAWSSLLLKLLVPVFHYIHFTVQSPGGDSPAPHLPVQEVWDLGFPYWSYRTYLWGGLLNNIPKCPTHTVMWNPARLAATVTPETMSNRKKSSQQHLAAPLAAAGTCTRCLGKVTLGARDPAGSPLNLRATFQNQKQRRGL